MTMKYIGLFGILSITIGGGFLVYVLSSVIINALKNPYSSGLSTLSMMSLYGGLIAFLFVGVGIWLIVNDAKPEIKNS